MTWTAPDVDRIPVPRAGDERAALDAFLDRQRQTLLWKCAGLTAEQLTDSTVEPSSLSLLGLVRHMAEVERWWFRRAFAGEQLTPVYCTEASPDGDFDGATAAGAEADFATYAGEVDLARKATRGSTVDSTFRHPRTNVETTLRWVYLHMIEEYARHNGHADLIRERIDGATGE